MIENGLIDSPAVSFGEDEWGIGGAATDDAALYLELDGWEGPLDLLLDLAPFKALRHAAIGMTGHLLFTAWDPDHAATQSRIVIEQIIRGAIGFDGLLLTDDLDMEALSGSVPERARRAIAAGCDVALNCWAKMDDMTGICEQLPALGTAGQARLNRALSGMGIAAEADQGELLATRDALLELAAA